MTTLLYTAVKLLRTVVVELLWIAELLFIELLVDVPSSLPVWLSITSWSYTRSFT